MKYLYIFGTLFFTVYGQIILKWRIGKLGWHPNTEGIGAAVVNYLRFLFDPLIFSGFISAFVICVMNICTVHNTRISFTQALDKNMEDKGRASSEELSSMISKMNAISSIIYNGVNSEEDGKGSIEGLAVSSTANNAVIGGAMTTMMTLGIPGDSVTAILIGSLTMYGMQPGLKMFTENADFTAKIMLLMLFANVVFCNVQFIFITVLFNGDIFDTFWGYAIEFVCNIVDICF